MSESKKNTPTRVPTQDGWRRIEGGRTVNGGVTPGRRSEKGTTVSQQQPYSNPPPPPRKDKK